MIVPWNDHSMVIREFAYIPYVFWAQPKKQKNSSGSINCAGWEVAGASHSSHTICWNPGSGRKGRDWPVPTFISQI